MTLQSFQDEDWQVDVEGQSGEFSQAAKHAVLAANEQCTEQSNCLGEYLKHDANRALLFRLDQQTQKDGYVGAAVGVIYALDQGLKMLRARHGVSLSVPFNVLAIGALGFGGPGEAVPIVPVDISEEELRAGVENLGDGGKIMISQRQENLLSSLRSEIKRRKIQVLPVNSVADLVADVLKMKAEICYEQAITKLCDRASTHLSDFLELEKANETYKQLYMTEVISPFNRLQSLQQQQQYYGERLREMERALEYGDPLDPICSQIKDALGAKGFDDASVEVHLDLPEEDEAPQDNEDKQYVAELLGESSDKAASISDLKRRFRQVVLRQTHPDHSPDDESAPEMFRFARRMERAENVAAMQALVLKYWHKNVNARSETEPIHGIDDMNSFDSAVTFLSEATVATNEFVSFLELKKMGEISRSREEWEREKEDGIDTIEQEKEEIIVRSQDERRRLLEIARKVRLLCAESKKRR